MRDDRGRRTARRACWVLAPALLAAGAAGAESLSGHLQVQYQQLQQSVSVRMPDGSLRQQTLSRSFWVQNYELNHSARIGENLNVFSQLRLTDLAYRGRPEATRTPYGTLRLSHPLYGLTGSHRPTTTTGVISPAGFGAAADSARSRQVISRNQETLLSGYLSAPKLPRLDLSWLRRHRNRDEVTREETGISRNARASWETGPLNLRAGYADLLQQAGGAMGTRTRQRGLDAGAGFRLTPAEGLSLSLDYDFADTRRGTGGGRTDRTRTHGAVLTGGLRQSSRSDWSLNYSYRRTAFAFPSETRLDDHDGGLVYTYRPTRALRFSSAGGLRTARTSTATELVRYLSATASADGQFRPGWQGVATAAHITNWQPGRGRYSVESARTGSRFKIRQGLDANADLQVTSTGDTAARGARVVAQAGAGVAALPLRSLALSFSERRYRSGPGLDRVTANSRATTWDVRWRPVRGLEADLNVSRTGALPRNDPRVTTTQWTLRWEPSRQLQLAGNLSRSGQSRQSGFADQLRGREVAGGRLLAGLWRSLTLNAGVNVAEPGRAGESRQYDAALTKTFGR